MQAHGFQPDFSPDTQKQLADVSAHPPQLASSDKVRDLRNLLWSSIDNDESRDLDQIEVAERLPGSAGVRIRVGIADVDAVVHRGSAIDDYAAQNTCTIYTGARVFPMLPESLSTDHTSLGEAVDRLAIVVEMDVDPAGVVSRSDVYPA